MFVVLIAVARGDKNLDFLSNQLASWITEYGFGLGVDLDDGPVDIDGNDGVRDGFQKRTGEEKLANGLR